MSHLTPTPDITTAGWPLARCPQGNNLLSSAFPCLQMPPKKSWISKKAVMFFLPLISGCSSELKARIAKSQESLFYICSFPTPVSPLLSSTSSPFLQIL